MLLGAQPLRNQRSSRGLAYPWLVDPAEWEPQAENWVRWARTPEHDPYWYYRSSFFEFLPSPRGATIEVGCGEGRVTRDLTARGFHMIGSDSSPTLVRYAKEEDPAGSYCVADGAALPCGCEAFDLVVAYNSLQVVSDMAATVREAARVLRPGGHLYVCVSHPFSDLGHFQGSDPDSLFAIRPSYFARQRVEDAVERDGLPMTFTGWTYTLEDYFQAFGHAGLTVQEIREPKPDETSSKFEMWRRVPMFLLISTQKARTR